MAESLTFLGLKTVSFDPYPIFGLKNNFEKDRKDVLTIQTLSKTLKENISQLDDRLKLLNETLQKINSENLNYADRLQQVRVSDSVFIFYK